MNGESTIFTERGAISGTLKRLVEAVDPVSMAIVSGRAVLVRGNITDNGFLLGGQDRQFCRLWGREDERADRSLGACYVRCCFILACTAFFNVVVGQVSAGYLMSGSDAKIGYIRG
jgi:hypothetical protein